VSQLATTPGGIDYLSKSVDELAAGNEQLWATGARTVRLRLLRPVRDGVAPVFAVSEIVAGEQTTHTTYDEDAARERFDELVDEHH
jgi:hypothetical protein